MSRHFKKENFEAFANKTIDDKKVGGAKANPSASASAPSNSKEWATGGNGAAKEWKVEGNGRLNYKWKDASRVLKGLWEWGRDLEKRTDLNQAEARYMKHAKGRALCLLGFGCVWAYYNPEHSIISRKWHEYRGRQIEQTPSGRIVQLLKEEGAEVRVLREAEVKAEEASK